MEYKITVSYIDKTFNTYQHFFTAISQSPYQAKLAYKKLKELFTAPTYKVEVWEWQSRGVQIDSWD